MRRFCLVLSLAGSSFRHTHKMAGSSSSPSSSSVSIKSVEKKCTQHRQFCFPTHVFWLRLPMKAHRFDKDFNHLATLPGFMTPHRCYCSKGRLVGMGFV